MNVKNKITALICAAAAAFTLTACQNENVSGAGYSSGSSISSTVSVTESSSSAADSGSENISGNNSQSASESISQSASEDSPASAGESSSSGSQSASESSSSTSSSSVKENEPMSESVMYITANGTTFTAKLADNSSAKALEELLRKGDITINAHDYGSFEKVGSLPQSLPQNNEQITTSAGDLILYQGNQFVFYYDTNSWNFTRLGRVEGVTTEQLKSVFGSGNVDLKLSLKKESAAPPSVPQKTLVAYFSCTGNTEKLARYAAEITGGDLYEIVPAVPYTSADLNYNNDSSRANTEQNDKNSRPAVSGKVNNFDDYGVVFVAYPIWWGDAPRVMSTFVESYDWGGKTVVPFCTSGSSPIGSSVKNLKALANGGNWLGGARHSSSMSKDEMQKWINSLDL